MRFNLCAVFSKLSFVSAVTNVENLTVRGRPQVKIWRMRIACWIPKAANGHLQHVTFIASPQQQRLNERHSMLRYNYIDCLVVILDPNYARSKLWACGRSLAEVTGSNSFGCVEDCLLCVFCVVR